MSQIEEMFAYFGSKNKLAKKLNVTPAAIARWKDSIPRGRAYQIEVMTQGLFKASDLAPERKSKLQKIQP